MELSVFKFHQSHFVVVVEGLLAHVGVKGEVHFGTSSEKRV